MPTTASPEHIIRRTPRVNGARSVSPSTNAWIKDVPNMAVTIWTTNRTPTSSRSSSWIGDCVLGIGAVGGAQGGHGVPFGGRQERPSPNGVRLDVSRYPNTVRLSRMTARREVDAVGRRPAEVANRAPVNRERTLRSPWPWRTARGSRPSPCAGSPASWASRPPRSTTTSRARTRSSTGWSTCRRRDRAPGAVRGLARGDQPARPPHPRGPAPPPVGRQPDGVAGRARGRPRCGCWRRGSGASARAGSRSPWLLTRSRRSTATCTGSCCRRSTCPSATSPSWPP